MFVLYLEAPSLNSHKKNHHNGNTFMRRHAHPVMLGDGLSADVACESSLFCCQESPQ